jgi:hypothetical protein
MILDKLRQTTDSVASSLIIHSSQPRPLLLLSSPFVLPTSFSLDTTTLSQPMSSAMAPNNIQTNLMVPQTLYNVPAASPMPSLQLNDAGLDASLDNTDFTPFMTQDPIMTPDPNIYPLDEFVDPWWQSLPARDSQNAQQRLDFHIARINMMHEQRKSNNDKYSVVYQQQLGIYASTVAWGLAAKLGLARANGMIAWFNKNQATNWTIFPSLGTFLRTELRPRLRAFGPSELRKAIDRAADRIQDPQARMGWSTNVAAELFQMFCGFKSAGLSIQRYYEQNPASCGPAGIPRTGGRTFEQQLGVTSQEFWAWLAPVKDDKEMGNFDHWFGN